MPRHHENTEDRDSANPAGCLISFLFRIHFLSPSMALDQHLLLFTSRVTAALTLKAARKKKPEGV